MLVLALCLVFCVIHIHLLNIDETWLAHRNVFDDEKLSFCLIEVNADELTVLWSGS